MSRLIPRRVLHSPRLRGCIFVAYMLAVLISTALASVAIKSNRELTQQTHRGLCAIKARSERQLRTATDILEHPDTEQNSRLIASFGVQFIRLSREQAVADIHALEDVKCS